MKRVTVIEVTLESDIEPSDVMEEAHQSIIDDLRAYGHMDCRTTSGGGPVRYRVEVTDKRG